MVNSLIRRGLYALPASGVLTAVPWLLILHRGRTLKSDPVGYARGLISGQQLVGGSIYLVGAICLLFGVLALYGYLATSRAARIAAIGALTSVIAVDLLLPLFGVLMLADTVLADVYLAGHTDVAEGMRQLSGGTFSGRIVAYFIVLLIVGLLASIANGAAVWQSGRLPKTGGVLVAIGLALSLTVTPLVAWVGALCLIVGGLSLAQSAQKPPARIDSPVRAPLETSRIAG